MLSLFQQGLQDDQYSRSLFCLESEVTHNVLAKLLGAFLSVALLDFTAAWFDLMYKKIFLIQNVWQWGFATSFENSLVNWIRSGPSTQNIRHTSLDIRNALLMRRLTGHHSQWFTCCCGYYSVCESPVETIKNLSGFFSAHLSLPLPFLIQCKPGQHCFSTS